MSGALEALTSLRVTSRTVNSRFLGVFEGSTMHAEVRNDFASGRSSEALRFWGP